MMLPEKQYFSNLTGIRLSGTVLVTADPASLGKAQL